MPHGRRWSPAKSLLTLQMDECLLLSGGMDSLCLAFWRRPKYALTINYGQVCFEGELRAAEAVCEQLKINHSVLEANCSAAGAGEMLCDSKCHTPSRSVPNESWWPFRNQLLVTLGAAHLTSLTCNLLVMGSVKSDSQYRDGTPAFFDLMNSLLAHQEFEMRVEVPAIQMSTLQLIEVSSIDLSLLAWSHSCHRGNFACGGCRGCRKNLDVWTSLRQNPHHHEFFSIVDCQTD